MLFVVSLNKLLQQQSINWGFETNKAQVTSLQCYIFLSRSYVCIVESNCKTSPSLTHWGRVTHIWVNIIYVNKSPDGKFHCENFKRIFLNEKDWILIDISLKFVPKGAIDNKSAMVQVMSWHRTGHKPLPVPNADPVHRYICATLGGHELN